MPETVEELLGKVRAHVQLGAGISGVTRRAALVALDGIAAALPSSSTAPRADGHKLITCGCGVVSTIDCKCCGAKAGAPCHPLDGPGIAALASVPPDDAPHPRALPVP